MNKLRIGTEELAKVLIDKMLEKHNVGYEHVKANPEINGISWFQYYTCTKEEEAEYKEWFIEFLKTNVTPKYSKKRINEAYFWFNSMWGLAYE